MKGREREVGLFFRFLALAFFLFKNQKKRCLFHFFYPFGPFAFLFIQNGNTLNVKEAKGLVLLAPRGARKAGRKKQRNTSNDWKKKTATEKKNSKKKKRKQNSSASNLFFSKSHLGLGRAVPLARGLLRGGLVGPLEVELGLVEPLRDGLPRRLFRFFFFRFFFFWKG